MFLLALFLHSLQAVSGGTDVLTLSATPIPRTLQMSMANLRDLSLMNTAPVGRREVNVSVSDEDNNVIRSAIVEELKRGGQVFVVVPFVRDVGPTHERYALPILIMMIVILPFCFNIFLSFSLSHLDFSLHVPLSVTIDVVHSASYRISPYYIVLYCYTIANVNRIKTE